MFLALATSLLLNAAPATVTVELKPSKSVLIVDRKKKGTGEKPMTLKLPAGKHVFRVEYKGDAHEEEVVAEVRLQQVELGVHGGGRGAEAVRNFRTQ